MINVRSGWKWIVLLGALLSVNLAWAQADKALLKAVSDAEKMMQQRMYPEAKDILDKVIKRDCTIARAHVLAGNIAYIGYQYTTAIQHYRQFIAKSGISAQPEIGQRLTNLEFDAGNYQAALNYANQLAQDSLKRAEFKLVRFTELRKARWAIATLKFKNGPEPELMGPPLNSLPLQYLPTLSPDEQEFYFTGRKGQEGRSDEDLYVVQKIGTGWSEPRSISQEVNSPYNEGACTISGDGNTMVFSVCEAPMSKTGCDLYISYRKPDGSWGRPVNMDLVNSRFWDSQPSLNPDGTELFFASSRPGGQGKIDIWVSNLGADGTWQTPVNLGPTINSAEDEGAPSLHANGRTLFFASKGHIGFGGYDLFLAERDADGHWSIPQNLGYPLNTHHHESALFVNAKGAEAYMTRDTREPPTSHIWSWKVPAWLTSKVSCAVIKGRVVGPDNKGLAAEVSASPPDAKGQVYRLKTNPVSGKFTLVLPSTKSYIMHAGAQGYMFNSWQTNSLERNPPEKTVVLQPLKASQNSTLAHLFFPTNGTTPLPESMAELKYLAKYLKDNVRTRVVIEGHTDDVGTAADNLVLSQKRAQAVVDFLKQQGIYDTRLTAVGFGKTKPIAPNTTEANRAKNRRINMIITPF